MRISRPAGDTGAAAPAVRAALDAYADGTGTEQAALTALAAARLLVPVVAIPAGVTDDGTEKETDMALPTLVSPDGRRAIIAFTGTEALRRWQEGARPVPVAAAQVWAAALSEADAAVIDVAGPVPLAVEGARLRALANGEPPPPPHEDPDIRAAIAAVTGDFTLAPGGEGTDLTVTLPTSDLAEASAAAQQIATRLAPRLRRGIEVRTSLSRTHPADSPPPMTHRPRPTPGPRLGHGLSARAPPARATSAPAPPATAPHPHQQPLLPPHPAGRP